MRTTRRFAALVVTAAFGFALSACSSPTPAENLSAACVAYSGYVSAVEQFQGSLDSSSTIEEIKTSRDNMKTARETLTSALTEVSEDRKGALSQAWEDFDKAVDDIDPNQTVAEGLASLSEERAAIKTAYETIGTELNC